MTAAPEPEDLVPVHLVLAMRCDLVRDAAAEMETDAQGNGRTRSAPVG